MAYLERATHHRSLDQAFGFKFMKGPDGWRWFTYDGAGGVAETGLAQSRAEAAALVIRALARAEPSVDRPGPGGEPCLALE